MKKKKKKEKKRVSTPSSMMCAQDKIDVTDRSREREHTVTTYNACINK